MERQKQYQSLVEIMAQARLLATLSDSDVVVSSMENIKIHTANSAVDLGFSDAKFNSDSIVRYKVLLVELGQ